MTDFNFTEYFDAAIADDQSRDVIIIGLVSEHKFTLNRASQEYAKYARSAGLTAATVSHKTAALAWLSEQYDLSEWTAMAVRDAVIDIQQRYDVAESTARDYTKAYSKDLGVTHPSENPRDLIFSWFKANEGTATKEAFKEYAKSIGRSESNANEYWKGYELHLYLTA